MKRTHPITLTLLTTALFAGCTTASDPSAAPPPVETTTQPAPPSTPRPTPVTTPPTSPPETTTTTTVPATTTVPPTTSPPTTQPPQPTTTSTPPPTSPATTNAPITFLDNGILYQGRYHNTPGLMDECAENGVVQHWTTYSNNPERKEIFTARPGAGGGDPTGRHGTYGNYFRFSLDERRQELLPRIIEVLFGGEQTDGTASAQCYIWDEAGRQSYIESLREVGRWP